MFNLTEPSKDSFLSIHPIEFYKLKKQKRVYYEENIEPRVGMKYYIYSQYSNGWYKRELTEVINPLIDLKDETIRIVYNEDEKADIKRILERDNISYREFVRRCVGEYMQSIIDGEKRGDSSWNTKNSIYGQYRKHT